MSISYLLNGEDFPPPAFNNRVGFTSNPSSSGGWYEDVDSGLIRIEYEFEGIGVNLLNLLACSFTTQLPLPVATILPFKGLAVVSGMDTTVPSGINGNVIVSRDTGTGIVTLSCMFGVLTSLTGLTAAGAKIGLGFSARVTY